MPRHHSYRVQELARISGVSVRALHHYDEIGLLVPKQRSSKGYRLYDAEDVLRLQQILIGRELGLALEEIRRSLDDPAFDRKQALLEQRRRLLAQADKTRALLRAVDAALATYQPKGAEDMDPTQIFAGFEPSAHEAEAEQRWGGTESYRESARRTKGYTEEDWRRFAAEQAAIYGDLAAAQRAGKAPTVEAVRALVERHRLALERWFYPCSVERHAALADLYEADPRFAQNIDHYAQGLTAFLVAAIRHNLAPGEPRG
jgi:DNA-binding transcriptional MerR regulator